MTQTSGESEYPTRWRYVSNDSLVEYRQLSEDTYELRSSAYMIIINKEGFDIYKDNNQSFEAWCQRNEIVATHR